MSKVIIDTELFENALKEYFADSFFNEIMDSLCNNDVFIGEYKASTSPSWISANECFPLDNDVYEVTAVPFSGSTTTYREYAYYDSVAGVWKSHFSGTVLHVLAWKPHGELFELPFM